MYPKVVYVYSLRNLENLKFFFKSFLLFQIKVISYITFKIQYITLLFYNIIGIYIHNIIDIILMNFHFNNCLIIVPTKKL